MLETIRYERIALMDEATSQVADGSMFRHSEYLDIGPLGACNGERLFLRDKGADCLASHGAELQ